MCIIIDLQGSHIVVGVQILSVAVFSHAHKEVSGDFETQEAAGHTWSDLEKVRYDALVEPTEAFFQSDNSNGVKQPLVFIAHGLHLIDLEPAPENVTVKVSLFAQKPQKSAVQRICASLSEGPRNCTSNELPPI